MSIKHLCRIMHDYIITILDLRASLISQDAPLELSSTVAIN